MEEQESKPDIEETLELQPHGGALKRTEKKPDATGVAYYGEKFTGYQRVEFIRELIPAFKELYYQRMVADSSSKLTHILREFNEQLEAVAETDENGERYVATFHPNTTTVRAWKKKWDRDIMAKKNMQLEVIDETKRVHQVLKTRDEDGGMREYTAPADQDLEVNLNTFAGELMNDAMQMLHDDQALEDIYDTDELIRRRNYMVSVFGHVTKMQQGKATLMLKASADKREEAHFLMDLMAQASAGTIGTHEISELKSNYQPKPDTVHVESINA